MRKMWQRSFLGVLIGCIGLTPGCATPPPCSPTEALPGSAPQAPARLSEAVQVVPQTPYLASSATAALERKVKMQERRIADLSTQLQLLKRIELDRRKP